MRLMHLQIIVQIVLHHTPCYLKKIHSLAGTSAYTRSWLLCFLDEKSKVAGYQKIQSVMFLLRHKEAFEEHTHYGPVIFHVYPSCNKRERKRNSSRILLIWQAIFEICDFSENVLEGR